MSIFGNWISKAVSQAVEDEMPSAIEKAFDRILPGMVERAILEKFRSEPNRQLSELGFNWALALSLKEFWPEMSVADAVSSLRSYIDTPHGHSDYDWSFNAAREIAREYVNEVGEVA